MYQESRQWMLQKKCPCLAAVMKLGGDESASRRRVGRTKRRLMALRSPRQKRPDKPGGAPVWSSRGRSLRGLFKSGAGNGPDLIKQKWNCEKEILCLRQLDYRFSALQLRELFRSELSAINLHPDSIPKGRFSQYTSIGDQAASTIDTDHEQLCCNNLEAKRLSAGVEPYGDTKLMNSWERTTLPTRF